MDVDVECFGDTSAMIDGFDLVLQLEDAGNKSLNNAVMAGTPGLGLWGAMQRLLAERCALSWHLLVRAASCGFALHAAGSAGWKHIGLSYQKWSCMQQA